jgi:hypothetical protein
MRFFRFCRIAAAIASLAVLIPAGAHDAHVHGVGKLDVALDNHALTLHLDTPLIKLVGFEHPANSAPDREAVQKMSRQLHAAAAMFVPTAAAACKAMSVKLVSAALDPALLDAAPAAAKAQHKAAAQHDHADLDGDFTFDCAHPEKLQSIDVKLFDAFPGFHRIDVQIVTPQRQSAATLTPGAAAIPL